MNVRLPRFRYFVLILFVLPSAVVIGLNFYNLETGRRTERLFDNVLEFSFEGLMFAIALALLAVTLGFMGYLFWQLLKLAALTVYVVVKRFGEWAQRELGER